MFVKKMVDCAVRNVSSNKEKPNNADTLNYLGFTSRKLGNYTEAEKLGTRLDPVCLSAYTCCYPCWCVRLKIQRLKSF